MMKKIIGIAVFAATLFCTVTAHANVSDYSMGYYATPSDFGGIYTVYDKSGKEMLIDIENKIGADIRGNLISFRTEDMVMNYGIYNIATGQKITDGNFCTENLAINFNGSYKKYSTFYNNSGKYGLINTETGEIIVKPVYMNIYEFYNDYAIAQKTDNSFAILDISGKETKTFNTDENWSVVHAKGTNIIFRDNVYNYFLYRGYAGIKTGNFEEIKFCEFDNQMLCHKENSYYILNSDCTLLKELNGYNNGYIIKSGYYVFDRINNGDEPARSDVVNKKGEFIITNIPSKLSIYNDYILCSEAVGNDFVIYLYDLSGKLIGGHIFRNSDTDNYTYKVYYKEGKIYIEGLFSYDVHGYMNYCLDIKGNIIEQKKAD